jgi:hypothetical protein
MTDYDVNELVNGTVDSIIEKFGALSIAQLNALHDLEKAQSSRTTLMDAIHRELKTREGSEEGGATGGASGESGPATFTQEQVDAMLAAQAVKHDQDMKLAVANARKGARPPEPAPVKALTPLKIAADALPGSGSLAALTSTSRVVFVDDTDTPLRELPGMTFESADYEPMGSSVTLKREVEFPRELASTEIAAAFLVEGTKPVARAALVKPFAIGGGRSAKLAPSTLQFATA